MAFVSITQFLCLILFHFYFHSFSKPLCPLDQTHALLQFKASFSIDPSASDPDSIPNPYPNTDSWTEGTDCCLCDGVSCDLDAGFVIGLHLGSSMLYGNFNPNNSLFTLLHLQELDLSDNDFEGSKIPSEFDHLLRLTHLNLSYSLFEGRIPLEMGHLFNLISLDLSRNSGLIVEETSHAFNKLIGNLTRLQDLDLSLVKLSSVSPKSFINLSSSVSYLKLRACELGGNFPGNIIQLPNLQVLDLSFNFNFSGSLPKSNWSLSIYSLSLSQTKISIYLENHFFENLKSLQTLRLRGCNFKGSNIGLFGNLSKLEYLDLSDNNFSCPIPSSFGNLVQLQFLGRSYGSLSGPIPSSFGNLSKLVELHLSNNNFSCPIPSSFGNFVQLQILKLSYSSLSGPIPSSFENLSKLVELHLSGNNFSCPIPSSIGNLVQLQFLKLSYSSLSGPIPSSFGNLSKLVELHLSGNNFSCPIPSSFGNLVQLQFLYLANSSLSGPILSSFGNLKQLFKLNIVNNKINGPIPNFFTKLTQLQNLYLYNNQFSGHIPSNLGNLSNLEALDLSNNQFTGDIPNVGRLSNIEVLDLSNNQFTGGIPNVGRISSLIYLDLSHNKLHGSTPRSIFNLVNLGVLILSSNDKLIGKIPSKICELKSLEILDLSNNSFSGPIPQCLGNLSISVLHLGMNKFNGVIPNNFAKGCSMRYLNFEHNILQGKIPPSISNCKDLEILDLSNNEIDDTFPSFLQTLEELQILQLRWNKLHGLVKRCNSSSNYSFSKLRILDLSNNLFNGPLPVEYFNKFKAMTNLDQKMTYMRTPQSSSSYDYSVSLTLKGLEIELMKIQTIFTSIDLSCNNFTGKIPKSVGELKSLKQLNLSHNHLIGDIKPTFGALTNLETLDLSSNIFIGRIPMELTKLTFLEVFNVSYNQLEGPIPTGKQFNAFENSSCVGNERLCGFQLTKPCNFEKLNYAGDRDSEYDENGFGWKSILTGYAFGAVFGAIMGYVVLKKRKPAWLVKLIEGEGHRRPIRSNGNNQTACRRRRN